MSEDYKDVLNPIQLLKDKNDYTLNRYGSFNNKLNFYLTLLTILSSIFIFIFGNQLPDISFIFKFNINNCFHFITKICISFIFVFSIFVLLFLLVLIFKEILKALEPITLSELDFESIDLYLDKKYKKSFDTVVKDYKIVIESNQDKINEKYNLLFKIKRNFIYFLINYFLIILIILGLILYKYIFKIV